MNTRGKLIIFWSTAVLMAVSLSSHAEITNSTPALVLSAPAPSAAVSFVRVMGALALVFAVFFGGLWAYRNWERLRGTAGRTPKLTVCETRALGQRHTLFVVGYERQRMLVASSPTGVTLLTALPDSEAPEPVRTEVKLPLADTSFGALMTQLLARKS